MIQRAWSYGLLNYRYIILIIESKWSGPKVEQGWNLFCLNLKSEHIKGYDEFQYSVW